VSSGLLPSLQGKSKSKEGRVAPDPSCKIVYINRPEFAASTRLYESVYPEVLGNDPECQLFQEGFIDITFCIGQSILNKPTNVYAAADLHSEVLGTYSQTGTVIDVHPPTSYLSGVFRFNDGHDEIHTKDFADLGDPDNNFLISQAIIGGLGKFSKASGTVNEIESTEEWNTVKICTYSI